MEKDIELLSQGKIFAEKEADRFRNLFNEAFSEKNKNSRRAMANQTTSRKRSRKI